MQPSRWYPPAAPASVETLSKCFQSELRADSLSSKKRCLETKAREVPESLACLHRLQIAYLHPSSLPDASGLKPI